MAFEPRNYLKGKEQRKYQAFPAQEVAQVLEVAQAQVAHTQQV